MLADFAAKLTAAIAVEVTSNGTLVAPVELVGLVVKLAVIRLAVIVELVELVVAVVVVAEPFGTRQELGCSEHYWGSQGFNFSSTVAAFVNDVGSIVKLVELIELVKVEAFSLQLGLDHWKLSWNLQNWQMVAFQITVVS